MSMIKMILAFSVALFISAAPPVFAQSGATSSDTNESSASRSMHHAGQSAEGAVSNTYHAAKRAVRAVADGRLLHRARQLRQSCVAWERGIVVSTTSWSGGIYSGELSRLGRANDAFAT